ncbi:MAG: PKD domain-containing protein [Candidatus Thermoplasmatota archaeon]
MDRKIIVLTLILTISLSLFSGCINKSSDKVDGDINAKSNYGNVPHVVLDAPEKAFFGEKVVFDASSSFDEGGKIVNYQWNLGDDTIIEGKEKISHTYHHTNNFDVDYPLIYTVVLQVVDNDGFSESFSHHIKLYPKEFKFYLTEKNSLKFQKPSLNSETIKNKGIKSNFKIEYTLDETVDISKSRMQIQLSFDKKHTEWLKNVDIKLYDSNGKELLFLEETFNYFESFWNKKTISFTEENIQFSDFKKMVLSIEAVSLKKNIDLVYGGDRAGYIKFEFK